MAPRPKPRVPRGFRDQFAAEVVARREMLTTLSRVYELHGFEPLETSAVEYVDCLGKFLPESDQPEGGIFSFEGDYNDWVALRYDLTAPLARVFAANQQTLPRPFRRYQIGPVWRGAARPGAVATLAPRANPGAPTTLARPGALTTNLRVKLVKRQGCKSDRELRGGV